MDYTHLLKRLVLPPGFTVPSRMVHDDVVATAITRADLADDVRGINASLAIIKQTRGGSWPTGPVTEDYNYVDAVWHECEFRDAGSFTYTVYAGEYIGCCYLYPMGRRTPLSEALLGNDIDVSWWVTPDAYGRGYYEKLYRALQRWVAGDFPFRAPHFSNAEIPA